MLYLWAGEWRYGSHQTNIYDLVMLHANAAPDGPDRPSLANVTKLLTDAARDANAEIAADDVTKARAQFAARKASGAISDQQLSQLTCCVPLPAADTGRAAALTACAAILGEPEKKQPTTPSMERLRFLSEFSKQLNEERQSFHTAWFQAQLVLLNLLLPLLTGLFGYIFGTQQAPSKSERS
jgi:hypothetical protein